MPGLMRLLPIALLACLTLAAPDVLAQSEPLLRLHSELEASARPALLCRDRESLGLIVSILARGADARARQETERADRIADLALRLQGEICQRPAAEDILILRCKIDDRSVAGLGIALLKISAVLRSEASRGEQPFFAWTNRTVAPLDTSNTETQAAEKQWCADAARTEEVVQLGPDVIQRIQRKLYEVGLNITQVDGQLNAETGQAVFAFQKWAGLPPTGQLTDATVQKITAMTAPSPWVAVAFDGRGRFGSVGGSPSRQAAETEAVQQFRRKSRGAYKMSAAASPSCIALATTQYIERQGRRRVSWTQAFVSIGGSLPEARSNVIGYCDREKGGGTCRIKEERCADAETARFDPKDIPVNARPPRFNPSDIPANSPPPPRFNSGSPPVNAAAPSASSNESDGADDEPPKQQ
jgi:peptidoglycan hydrolase-like protein with peptidoglycan-binding domain